MGVARTLKSLRVTYRGSNSRSCTQAVSTYRWTDATWVQLDSRTLGTTEVTVDALTGGTLASYVSGSAATGDVAVRVRCQTTGGTFTANADLLRLVYTK